VIYSILYDGTSYVVWADDTYTYNTKFWFRESAERFIYDLEYGYELFNEEDWTRRATAGTWSLL
jgi:hypothetical protein